MKIFILNIFLLLASVNISAQIDKTIYSTKEIKGQICYEYVVEIGDGLFSIGRKFGVTQADIHLYNEVIDNDLKIGQIVYIPKYQDNDQVEISTNNADVLTHTVAAKETLYGISKKYDIPTDTILSLNPKVANGLKVGDVIILSRAIKSTPTPTEESNIVEKIDTTYAPKTHLVKRRETLYSISQQYDVAIHDILKYNPKVENEGLKAGEYIYLEMPRETVEVEVEVEAEAEPESVESNNEIAQTEENNTLVIENDVQNDVVTDSIETIVEDSTYEISTDSSICNITKQIKVAYLLPFMAGAHDPNNLAKKFIEFYQGALIALENTKEYGIDTEVYTFDIQRDTIILDSILNLPIMKEVDVIIGPAYPDQVDKVARFTKENNIINISPFTASEESDNHHDLFLQFNPHRNDLFKQIFDDSNSSRRFKYIFARFANCKNKGNQFIDELGKQFTANDIEYSEVLIDPNAIDSLTNFIGNDTTMLVFGSSAPEDVDIILKSLKESNLNNLFIWGFEEWEHYTRTYPRTYYYSLFHPTENSDYTDKYAKYFGLRANKTIIKYDLIGYDITMFALLGLNKTDDKLAFETIDKSIYLQSSPQFQFIGNRYLNLTYFLFYWNGINNTIITDAEE